MTALYGRRTARTGARRHGSATLGATALGATVLAAAVLVAGCSSSPQATSGTGAPTGGITVFAASSLTSVFAELGKRFEAEHPGTTVRFSYGASSALAQQILSGAPADVFAAASVATMKQVVDGGSAADPQTFATNVAAIAVSPAATTSITSVADLAKPGVKVALCQPQVPCGALAQSVLAKADVTVKPVTQGLDVKSTLAYVSSGEADAAIVYATDIKAAGSTVKGVQIPAAVNGSTAYPIVVVTGSKNPDLARSFTEFVRSASGLSVLTAAGFRSP
jgi:molybdate transport system substrate-binding protein